MNSIIINLFAGPGAGKSTIASGLFYELKKQNKNVELVQEFAKDLVYGESYKKLKDQFLIAAEQHHRIWRLNGLVKYIITDSPLLLSAAYTNDTELQNLTNYYSKKYNNFNIFLNRNPDTFKLDGRIHNLEESIKIDKIVKNLLEKFNTRYTQISVDENTVQKITELIDIF